MSPAAPSVVGRATEQAALTRALAGRTRLIVVTGGAGSGKTTLVAHALAGQQASGLLSGWAKHADGEPGLRPLMAALRQLISSTLERLFEPAAGRALLEARLGPLAALLAGEDSPGAGSASPAATSRATLEQAVYAAREVIQWASGLGVPCVLWLDDWDRAAPDVGTLYSRLLEMPDASGLCLIGSGRTWPAFLPVTPDQSAVIHLGPLAPEDRHDLLEALTGPQEAARLQALLAPEVNTPLAVIDQVRSLTRGQEAGEVMPSGAAVLVYVVAAVGDSMPLDQLSIGLDRRVDGQDPSLGWLVGAGTVRIAENRVWLHHDTVRDAVLAQPLDPQMRTGLVDVARRLLEQADPEACWAGACLTLCLGTDTPHESLVSAADSGAAPLHAASLARAAGIGLARLETGQARRLAETALALGGGLEMAATPVLRAVAATALAAGDLQPAQEASRRLRALAASREEIAEAYRLSATCARQASDRDAALSLAREGLGRLGIRLPRRSGPVATLAELLSLLWRVPMAERASRGDIRVERGLVDLIALAATIAFETEPQLVVHIAASMVCQPGSRGSGAAASSMVFLSGLLGRHADAARWGDIALERLSPLEPERGGVLYRAHFFGRMWRNPASSFDAVHEQLHALLLAEGNIPLATWALRNAAMLHWRSGRSLETTAQAARRALAFARDVGDELNAVASQQILDCVQHLGGRSGQLDRTASLDRPGTLGLESHTMTWLACHTYTGDVAAGMRELATTERRLPISLKVHPGDTEFRFHRAVTMLQANGAAWPEDVAALASGARLNPADHAARHAILLALQASHAGRSAQAASLIQRAMALAVRHGRHHDRGLAARLAAQLAPTLAAEAIEIAADAAAAWDGGPPELLQRRFPTGAPDLARRLEQAEEELRAKGRLLAMVGHELRTPLQAATGAAELLSGRGGQEGAILGSALDRLGRIVDDLSDIAVAEGSALAVQPQPFEPEALLRELIATHQPVLAASGRSLAATITGSEGWHFADARRLGQIADNLLTNAARHGAGEVSLELGFRAGRLVLTVEDDGAGIAPDEATRLFEPFVRGAQSEGRAGHGLGLWLARKLALAMGGSLDLVPQQPGCGARFELDVPCPSCPPPRRPAPAVEGKALTILLVEDEPLSRTVLKQMLAGLGHTVVLADGRASATTVLDGLTAPDAALVDLNLGDGTGLDVARDLRARWPGAAMRIIVATAELDRKATSQISGLVDVWLAKPVGSAQLAELFGRARSGRVEPAAAARADSNAATILTGYALELHQAVAAQDTTASLREAHRLTGAAGLTGHGGVSDLCRALGTAVKEANWTLASSLADQITARIQPD